MTLPATDSIHSPESQHKILMQLLSHTLQNSGWSAHALYSAAIEAGFVPALAHSAFDGRVEKALDCLFLWINQEMEAQLQQMNVQDLKVTARIRLALQTRFHIMAPYKLAIAMTLKYLMHPVHILLGIKYLSQSVSCMWYAAHDTSTDFNYYSKRAILAAVYSATLKHWLQTPNDNLESTFAYLDQRLANVGKITKFKHSIKKWLK